MTSETLFGFIGNIRGNEGNLVAMDAVSVTEDGDYIRYASGEGVEARTLAVHELDYVHLPDNPAGVRWRPGQALWFAGRNLVARASVNSVVQGFAVGWHATKQGHRLTGGTPAQLRRTRDNYAGELSAWFRKYVLDSEEVKFGEARATWDLLQAFDNLASPRRSLNAALFAKDVQQDMDRFDAVRLRAVRSGAFPTVEAFDAELERLRTFMADPPLYRKAAAHVRAERPAADAQSDLYARSYSDLPEYWRRPIPADQVADLVDMARESSLVLSSTDWLSRFMKTRTSTP